MAPLHGRPLAVVALATSLAACALPSRGLSTLPLAPPTQARGEEPRQPGGESAPVEPPTEERVEQPPRPAEVLYDPEAEPPDDPLQCGPNDRPQRAFLPPRKMGKARIVLPAQRDGDEGLDVLVHFHNGEAVRRAFVQVARPMALVTLDLGEGSRVYADPFVSEVAFTRLLADVDAEIARHLGAPDARAKRVFLSSWSAGFGAAMAILKRAPGRVSGALFLDSLYGAYQRDGETLKVGAVYEPLLLPAFALARRAIAGESFMFVTHSAGVTHGYASTEEVAKVLLARVGVEASPPGEGAPEGMKARADAGKLHYRGYGGMSGRDHCRHLGMVVEGLRLAGLAR